MAVQFSFKMYLMFFRQGPSRFAYLLIFLAGTLASCAAPTPTATVVPTSTQIPTATSTPLPTTTPSLTPTPIPGADWIGEWKIYINGNEAEWFGDAEILIEGSAVSGTFAILDPTLGSLYYKFDGILEFTTQVISGQWQLNDPGGSGSLRWKLSAEEPVQFSGNLENGKFRFCGWRDGEKPPSPCEWP